MKVTIEFKNWNELIDLLTGLASVIELTETTSCDICLPMTPAEMKSALKPPAKIETEK